MKTSWGFTDESKPITIKVLELDKDKDGWDDNVERLINKYYPEFDLINETPTKEDVVKAIINAVKQYRFAPQDEKKQIRDDIKAIIQEYLEEVRKA